MGWLKKAGTGAGKSIAGTVVREGLRGMAWLVGSELLRRLAGSTPVTALIFGGIEQLVLTIAYRRNALTYRKYVLGTARNLGSTVGSVLGAIVMAGVLSIVPILGTLLGIFVGSFLGSIVGGEGLRLILRLAWEEEGGRDGSTTSSAPGSPEASAAHLASVAVNPEGVIEVEG